MSKNFIEIKKTRATLIVTFKPFIDSEIMCDLSYDNRKIEDLLHEIFSNEHADFHNYLLKNNFTKTQDNTWRLNTGVMEKFSFISGKKLYDPSNLERVVDETELAETIIEAEKKLKSDLRGTRHYSDSSVLFETTKEVWNKINGINAEQAYEEQYGEADATIEASPDIETE